MKRLLPLLLITSLLASTYPVHAADPNPSKFDPVEIKQFFDAVVPSELETYNIPGATLSVVADGELVYSKGYGYANYEEKLPVDAGETRFHIGSISKLFVWTTIMQLVEQGKLDLHTDVNTYLTGVQLPKTFEQPVTLHHLMTHTPGFDDQLSNLFAYSPSALVPLETYIKQEMPERVYAPGDIIAYSNWGTCLAALIIQQVSGEPYDQYVQKHILTPLGMSQSSFEQPAGGNASLGYTVTPGGNFKSVDEYVVNSPAGALSSTANDMAAFMIAHLNKGSYHGSQMLKPETTDLMHKQHFTSDPRLNGGLTYGFLEREHNGIRELYHSGGTSVFFSILMLIPDKNFGVFYSFNGDGGSDARWDLRQKILDHFFPIEAQTIQPMDGYADQVKEYEGLYRESRFGYSTLDKIIYAFSWVDRANANSDGTLKYRGSNWIETGPDLFQEVNGQGTLVFTRDEAGQIQRAYQDIDPHEAQIRLSPWEYPIPLTIIGIIFVLVLWSGPIVWLVNSTHRRKRIKDLHDEAIILHIKQVSAVIGGLHFLFFLWIGINATSVILRNPIEMMGAMDSVFRLPLMIPVIAGILTIILIGLLAVMFRRKAGSVSIRTYYLVFTLCSIGYTIWLAYWNMLGWHL